MARRRRTRRPKVTKIYPYSALVRAREEALRKARKKRRKPCDVYKVCNQKRELCRDRFGRFISNRPA